MFVGWPWWGASVLGSSLTSDPRLSALLCPYPEDKLSPLVGWFVCLFGFCLLGGLSCNLMRLLLHDTTQALT